MAWLVSAIREDVIARLIGYRTSAGSNVQDSDVSPIDIEDMPQLSVFTPHTNGNLLSRAGGEQNFEQKLNLVVRVNVSGTQKAVVPALDLLIGQVTDGLLADPGWIGKMINRVTELKIACEFANKGEWIEGEGVVWFVCEYNELYPVRIGSATASIDLSIEGSEPLEETIVL